MKILFAGDTHKDIGHVDYLLDVAQTKGAGKVFVLGDFGAWEHMDFGVKFLDDVEVSSSLYGIPVYFLDGNHDKTSLIVSKYGKKLDGEGFMICRPNLKYAPRGHRWTWGKTSFISLGGAYSTDKQSRLQWEREAESKMYAFLTANGVKELLAEISCSGRYWFPEEEMTDQDMRRILRSGPDGVDVILSHDKPRSSSPGWDRKTDLACLPNQDRIQWALTTLKPELLLHGHLHVRYEDVVRCGNDDQVTVVIGLDCNWKSSELQKSKEDSWYVMEV